MPRIWMAIAICAALASGTVACARTPDWTGPEGKVAIWIPSSWQQQNVEAFPLQFSRFDSGMVIASCTVSVDTYPENASEGLQEHLNGYAKSQTVETRLHGMVPTTKIIHFSNTESRQGVLLADTEMESPAGARRAYSWLRQFVVADGSQSRAYFVLCETSFPVRGDIGTDVKGVMTSMKMG